MKFYLLFALIIFSIHNIEEAIWLTKWAEKHSPLKNKQSHKQFLFSVSLITIIGWLVFTLYNLYPNQINTAIFYGFLASMIVNAFFPHIALSIKTKSYMPGLATAIILIIPTFSLIILNAIKNGTITVPSLLLYLIIVGIVLLTLLFIFDYLSRIIFKS